VFTSRPHLKMRRFISAAGSSISPNSDCPLKLPGKASGNSPRLPSVRVIVRTGGAPLAEGATSMCLMFSNLILTAPHRHVRELVGNKRRVAELFLPVKHHVLDLHLDALGVDGECVERLVRLALRPRRTAGVKQRERHAKTENDPQSPDVGIRRSMHRHAPVYNERKKSAQSVPMLLYIGRLRQAKPYLGRLLKTTAARHNIAGTASRRRRRAVVRSSWRHVVEG
jgi:hypothetical protein